MLSRRLQSVGGDKKDPRWLAPVGVKMFRSECRCPYPDVSGYGLGPLVPLGPAFGIGLGDCIGLGLFGLGRDLLRYLGFDPVADLDLQFQKQSALDFPFRFLAGFLSHGA